MKKILLALSLAALVNISQAQKVINDPNAEARTISSFHALQVSNSFDVIISQGNEESIAVSASNKEDLAYIKTEVDNGVLKIWFDQKNKMWPKNRKLKAYVSVKSLDAIRAGGASDINIEGGLTAANLKIDFSGASDLEGQINVSGNLDIELSGASDITINGSANTVKIDLSGASDVKAYDFKTSICSVEASGASSVHISVDKELSARLSGASSVSYKGDGLIRDIKTSGASSISRKS
ncbi:MAG TPA: head GIN domain-containing protein [Flavisolibacter sp.]|jgi:hypothetical protein|nr:head GIN domain-containing protein [Flavisolibacter sp.]